MPDESIRKLVATLRKDYHGGISPYGGTFENAEEEHGVGWRLDGAPVLFSAITLDGTLPVERYDLQIESDPAGDYIFTGQYSLTELLELVPGISAPKPNGPAITDLESEFFGSSPPKYSRSRPVGDANAIPRECSVPSAALVNTAHL